jgi:hypothetical protein
MRSISMALLMGFFSSIFGCSKGPNDSPKRYVTESALRENLSHQATMDTQTIAQLRKQGVTDTTKLKLEFFFYTDDEAKAQGLVKELQALEYQVECEPSSGDSRLFVVTGWTTPIQMGEEIVLEWTDKMCRLGFQHDCDFDGWGTYPNQ